ncbi:transcription-repair coupling factor [Natroniella sulfidigena]|uniref:transcription-repair coupling factor n=1 Tax=Natroniella sulfidigena TaxID=723921 RepID=UPI00200A9FDB|nr:transcription-repair coupling factor [Natroniella sulfidigena]MCK8817026.1 transcription-repair coupling factor [Natroniella sulfidigena]
MKEDLLSVLNQSPNYKELIRYCQAGKEGQIIGVDESSQNFLLANLKLNLADNLLIVTSNLKQADLIYEDLVRLLSEKEVLLFPRYQIFPHESLEIEQSIKRERLQVLKSLATAKSRVIVAPIQALLERVIPLQTYQDYRIDLELGAEVQLDQLTNKLVQMGYRSVTKVEAEGEFSVRGGILDIYPLTYQNPVRIDLFGQEIDSIRQFDLVSQSSQQQLEVVRIGPATEFILSQEMIESGCKKIKEDLEATAKKLEAQAVTELREKVATDLERIREGVKFPEIRQYLNYFQQQVSLLDYFTGFVTLLNPLQIKKAGVNFLEEVNQTYITMLEQGSLLTGYQDLFIDFNHFFYGIKQQKIYLSPTKKNIDYIETDFELEISSRRLQGVQGKLDLLVEQLTEQLNNGYKIVIGLNNLKKAHRLKERLAEDDLPVIVVEEIGGELKVGNIILTTCNLKHGFLFSEAKFILYTENELFKEQKRKKKRAVGFNQGVEVSSFTELNQGDYVVHENHGIGHYLGIKTLQVQGKNKDYLLLSYADDDKLYVPTDQVDLIQKYIGMDDKEPKLHKLDGDNWNKVKSRVKKSVAEMAEELLELYAQRELKKGYAFSEDTVWQQEFEAKFPYQETPDQLTAIEKVKEDMESTQPMDRLLCGDVGYGKTEVAIRAIFKAVMDGKQAGFLVPTTILAQQHWNNLEERFEDYPIEVAMLSRFRTATEQKKIIEGLKIGTIDVVIGTHRLLSNDVKFKDLGLVVVDEEQRFGVSQKERLKQLKKSIDVLTMTATPIPRTLHMSLVGVRDISLIETPPENRYPIRTYVREYDQNLVKTALNRELNRGGQVYFVHNRVKDIKKLAAKIKNLVPEAEIAVAHGQMSELKLEKLMLDFLEGKFDILVCTTIIETGLDISNVNTIIINRADKMGLSQLYQLRGRVGRSNKVAYAYLLYEQDQILSEIAEKRLKAIKEFTKLGSGFKIAMRDLEIRGAGNILGPEQHGHIEAIGFSLYCKLLEDAITELQTEGEEQEEEIELELKVDAYLSEDYIPDSKQKIEIYKKIDALETEEECDELVKELKDRFGQLTQEVIILLELAKIKIRGNKLAIAEIKEKAERVTLKFFEDHSLSGRRLLELSHQFADLKFINGTQPRIEVKVTGLADQQKVKLINAILEFLLAEE